MAFIMSKYPVTVRLEDGSMYSIPKDFVGDVPEHVFNHWYIQQSIASGDIVVPEGRKDSQLEVAAEAAVEKKAAASAKKKK